MTYSIVARDAASGAMGVAVQTSMFAVGTVVPWARPGIGVVASQAMAEPAYGPRCLDAIAAGSSAAEALARAQEADPGNPVRQVAVLAADGSVAAFTGERCIDHAGHIVGDGFAVAANMMARPEVWPAMAEAFTAASGPLARRLLATLCAAQDAGGDARGVMSAAVVVVDGSPAAAWEGRAVDVRVDRSSDPLGDLAGLLDANEAYDCFGRGLDALSRGDADKALAAADQALTLLPDEENVRFLRAGALFATGDLAGASASLASLVAARASWAIIVRSYAAKGFLALPPGVSVDDLFRNGQQRAPEVT